MTLYLFKVIGLYFLIIGLSVLINPKIYKQLIKELSGPSSLLKFVFGFIALVIGILMVTAHNSWNNFAEILVSLYGWISLIKGATLLTMPEIYRKLISKLHNDQYLNYTGIFYLVLGLYITYSSFA
ncbi:MAG: hypothetical protein HOA17_05380 [Candidatus Melainabacteria bacterium]|jgi:uncharacterized protein YjeT (DUF2065 family)|nr:hypothetical protein [Candidatus Melainabacteria bacterium]